MAEVKIENGIIIIRDSFESIKERYLKEINDAITLGDTAEVERLQSEWAQKKLEYQQN